MIVLVLLIMSFNLENLGFAVSSPSDTLRVSPPDGSLPPPTPSTPSSGDSARCLCPHCHGRMSSFALNKHTFCFKCLGVDCDSQSKCDECMLWPLEEMEAYVRLYKLLASKSCKSKFVPTEYLPAE